MFHLLGFVLGSSWLLYIGSPLGFGLGSNWLLYIGVPLIIGIWAQIRVTARLAVGARCVRTGISPELNAHAKSSRQRRFTMSTSWRQTIFSATITIRQRSSCTCRATFITLPRWQHWASLRTSAGTRFNTPAPTRH